MKFFFIKRNLKIKKKKKTLKGDQAKAFFLKSGLATQVLGQIWNLADLNKDGKLDAKEFSIACYLIKKALTSPLGSACIPATLPSGLLIDPPVAAVAAAGIIKPPPTTVTSSTPQMTPLITPPIVSSTTTTTTNKPLIQPTPASTTPMFQVYINILTFLN